MVDCVDGVCGGWLYNGIWWLTVDGDVVVVLMMFDCMMVVVVCCCVEGCLVALMTLL